MEGRIAVIARKRALEKVASSLGAGYDFWAVSDFERAARELRQNEFDLVLVECYDEGSLDNCRRIAELCRVPVMAMVHGKEVNWQEMFDLGVAGYLPENASAFEKGARIKAVMRRQEISRAAAVESPRNRLKVSSDESAA